VTPIHVGDIVIRPVLDGVVRLSTDYFIGSDWTDHQEFIHPDDGKLHVPVGAFVFETGGRTVLIDAGIGDVHNKLFDGGALMDNLISGGTRPEDVDVVLVSHLHSDHIGWLELNGRSVFANATIFVGAADWEYFVEGEREKAGRLKVLEPQVSLLDADDVTIAPGVTTLATPGHTPGHTSAVISSGVERMVVLGDALHCPAQLTETEWQVIFDVDPEAAGRVRTALLREAEEPNTRLLPMHFPGMQAARLLPGTGKRRWVVPG
jgi:glyoxylase-like metal-dependent hydrolase (beta-lactamase superfamily II)